MTGPEMEMMEAVADQVPDESRYDKLVKILEALLLASLPLSIDQLYRRAADLGVGKGISAALGWKSRWNREVACHIQVRRDTPSGSAARRASEARARCSKPWPWSATASRSRVVRSKKCAALPCLSIIRTLLERGWIVKSARRKCRVVLHCLARRRGSRRFQPDHAGRSPDLPEIRMLPLSTRPWWLGELPAPTKLPGRAPPESAVHERLRRRKPNSC